MRDRLAEQTKVALLAQNKERLSTLRLINAAIKDRDIAARSEENALGVSDFEILKILAKMVKQRIDSIRMYEEAGRIELAESERSEILVIEEFMPKQLSDVEVDKVVEETIAFTNATSIRDMGRVMALLKEKYSGKADFAKVSLKVKEFLVNS